MRMGDADVWGLVRSAVIGMGQAVVVNCCIGGMQFVHTLS